jgi:hypothetical protein
MKIKLVSLMVCTLALAACGQENAPQTTETTPAATPSESPATVQAPAEPVGPPPPAAPEGSKRVAAVVGEGAASALKLLSNESVSGSYSPTKDGTLVAFGVYIGNSRRTSDGSLTLNLCQAEDCQDVTLPLADSRDNDFLIFTLARPLTVTTGQTLSYKLQRSADATKPVAIWTYTPGEGMVSLTGPAGEDTGRVAKVAMYLQPGSGT